MADAETDAKPVDQDALVAGIEQTRLQLARTIDAIADRVSPQKNVSRALDQVRQRVSRVDLLIVGAAAGAVLVSVTVVFLVRRRKR
jgi:NAD(P)-dependent dehydrogenase (short-subunit alcohol dehydrogenase family)